MLFAPGDRVGPYEVLSPLGSGGMGEVYLANDPRLARRVALKVLRQPPGAALDRTRVLREGRAAARIVHPRVAAVYDVLDADGHFALVLEYVEGRTLRRVMEHGPLEVTRALDIAGQVCDALQAAHAQGVVHGDVKPENVCLTDEGQVKVLDFGIARVAARPRADASATMTTEGASPPAFAGTPRYAAPELFGGAAPDERADVYAVAAMLFEMLSGVPPHQGEGAFDIGLKALGADPPRVDALRPEVSPGLADTLARALCRERARRTPSAASLAADLRAATTRGAFVVEETTALPHVPAAGAVRRVGRRGLLVAGLAVLAVAAGIGVWRWTGATAEDRAPRVLAVLPLAPAGGDGREAALGVGIADTLVAGLSGAPDLVVVSRRASAAFVERRGEWSRIARDLGATLLVDGTVQAFGDTVRVSLTLVRPDGSVRWGQSVEGRASDLFGLQRQLANGLRQALRVATPATRGGSREAAERSQGPATLDMQALDDYSAALQRLDRPDLAGNTAIAIDGFTRALARDPGFVLAHVGLAEAYVADYRQSRDGDALTRATVHAQEAARLAPYHAETWVALARTLVETGRRDEARQALQRAIALQPTHDEAWCELAIVRASAGDRGGAADAFRRAIALRPGYWRTHHEFGRFLFGAGALEAAAGEFTRVIEVQPDSPRGYQALGTVRQAQGRLEEALAHYERAIRISPSVNAHLNAGVLHHWAGRFREAVDAAGRAASLAPDDPVPARNIGDGLARLGDLAGARAAYARALGLAERELTRNAEAHDMRALRAVLLAKLGRFDEAGREAATAVAEAPDLDTAHYAHAVVLALGGRRDEARAALDRAIALGTPRALAERDEDVAGLLDAAARARTRDEERGR